MIPVHRVAESCDYLMHNPLATRRIMRILELPTTSVSLAVSFGTATIMWAYSHMVTTSPLEPLEIETIFELWGKQLDTIVQKELNHMLEEPDRLPKYPIAIMVADRRYACIHYPERDVSTTSRTFDLMRGDWCPDGMAKPVTIEGISCNLVAVAIKSRPRLLRVLS